MTASIPRTTTVTPAADRPIRAPYSRLAATGFILAAVAPAILGSAGMLVGVPSDDVGFFALSAAVPLVAAASVWWFGTWAKIAAVGAGIVTAGLLFWTMFGLSYPASFADFVPGVVLPLGLGLGIGGSIASVVQTRRGGTPQRSAKTENRVIALALAIVVVAMTVSGILHLTGRVDADAALGAPDFTITMANFEFTEPVYRIDAGPLRTIRVRNDDAFVHTVTIPELGVDEVILPRTERAIQLRAPRGTYTIYCEPHADMSIDDPERAGMAATLVAE